MLYYSYRLRYKALPTDEIVWEKHKRWLTREFDKLFDCSNVLYPWDFFFHIFQALCCSCASCITTGIFCLVRQNKKRLQRAFSMSVANNGYTTQPRTGCLKHFYCCCANRWRLTLTYITQSYELPSTLTHAQPLQQFICSHLCFHLNSITTM